MRVSGERFAFDEDVWAEEVGRLSATGLAHADAVVARSEGPDGTLLAGCAKACVPLEVEPSRAPHGFVFAIRVRADSGRVTL